MDGWVGGLMGGWMDGWMDGGLSCVCKGYQLVGSDVDETSRMPRNDKAPFCLPQPHS
jgi:hypothetical protein